MDEELVHMKKIGLVTLILLITVLPLRGLSAQGDAAIPGCDVAATDFFQQAFFPLFDDYVRLRDAFIETGDFGVTGGQLIELREALETAIDNSPVCLHGFALQMVMSVGNMQTAILFLILSSQIDDPDLRASLGEIGGHYARRSDEQFQNATEIITGWGMAPLAMTDRPSEAA
jgi:hypothetical protein